MDVSKVGRDNEPSFGWSEAIGPAFDGCFPKLLSGGGLKNDDFIVQSRDELVSCDDEFDRSGVIDLP